MFRDRVKRNMQYFIYGLAFLSLHHIGTLPLLCAPRAYRFPKMGARALSCVMASAPLVQFSLACEQA